MKSQSKKGVVRQLARCGLGLFLGFALLLVASGARAGSLESGLAALEKSDYPEAERNLRAATKGRGRAKAWLGLGQLHLVRGQYAEAIGAAKKAARGQSRIDAAEIKARALAAQGKTKEAMAALQRVKDDPKARRVRVLLGELLIASGRSSEARDPLMTLVIDYNDDRIRANDAEGLALVARAAYLLRSAADANDAFNESERAQKRLETLLWRGELFLEKYDSGHAEEVVREALKLAPNHPDARVMLAHVKLDQALDFNAAEAAVKKALAVNPKHTGAYFIRAGLALRDFDLKAATRAVDRGLATNPVDLPLLSMRATIRFLADDRAGFEAAKKKVLSVNPEYSTFYQIVGEFAEWEHRYHEIVAMMQHAVKVDPRDGKAWAVLGLNQIRLGDETPGVESLRKAWQFDRFNVRVYNTLNMYERDIPNIYETVQRGSFRFRFDKTERAVLERYVPPMLEEAFSDMVKHYNFKPTVPVGIELYSSREHFSVRTSGLPAIGIQGVCFGTTLAAASPKGDAFNWGNVLWHELAHVFAIQLSKAHVPRWFTEGLSELETFVRRPEWQREEDMALYAALRAKRIPEVAHFNRAFTHVDDPSDVTMAYYAASQIVVYIEQRWGMPKIAQMLKLWGQGKRDEQVVKQALGVSLAQLDRAFREWLKPRLRRYENQFVPDLHAPGLEEAQAAAKANPSDARKQVELVIALLRERKGGEAEKVLGAASRAHPKNPDLRYLSAQIAVRKKKLGKAKALLETMVRDKQDGYAIRIRLADLAEAKKDKKTLRAHLEAARRFDPTQVEALQALHDLAKKEKKKGEVIATLRELAVLDQHERRAARRLMVALADVGLWNELRQVGARAVFLDVHSPVVHKLYGKALAKSEEPQKAFFELESALLCKPEDKEASEIHALIAKVHRDAGRVNKARASAREALKLDPSNKEAKALAGP